MKVIYIPKIMASIAFYFIKKIHRFVAKNISFVNSAGQVGQAVALYVDADKAVFKNCRFIGNQDTIYLGGESSRQYFVDCYIEGTTDFIFGPSTAVFKNCIIYCKSDSYITAPNTPQNKDFGFVFLDCKIEVNSKVSKVYLGRPWRAYAKSVFIRCEFPKEIAPEGWDNWSNQENEKTVFFAEYNCKGEGFKPKERVSWSYQLHPFEAIEYTSENIFGKKASIEDEWHEAF